MVGFEMILALLQTMSIMTGADYVMSIQNNQINQESVLKNQKG